MTDRSESVGPSSRAELLTLTRDLVSIPSHADEARVGDFIEAWLTEHTDSRVTRDDAGNVIARRALDDSGPTDRETSSLALVGHHDVVPPDDSQVAAVDGDAGNDDNTDNDDNAEDDERASESGRGEYVVTERDGRLYGRGTADMKGAVAAAMCAFRDAAPSERGGPNGNNEDNATGPADDALSVGELVFASFVGEEMGGIGARHAIDSGFAPDYAIIGEGSTNYSSSDVTDVAVAHKGRRASTITARGDAAHASEPDSGTNAIYRACDAVEVLRNIDAPTVEIAGEALRGSVVVTEIDGGAAWNVIPDRCTITIDERTVPGERAPLEQVRAIEGIEWTVNQDLPPMRCRSEEFAAIVHEAAAGTQDGEPRLVTKPHATDAGWLAEAGTACVICGPAEPGEAHTKSESVSIDVLERCYRVYRRAVESLA